MKATKEQLKSYKRVCRWQGKLPQERSFSWDGVLFLDFGYILIGIERDGYAHSQNVNKT